jgi:hypothetical protein
MNTGVDREARRLETTAARTVFMGSGLAAAQRPGMTIVLSRR